MSSKPEIFTENDAVGFAAVSGKRGLSQRASTKLMALGAAVFMTACMAPGAVHAQSWYSSPNTSANTYTTQSAMQGQNTETGTVVAMRQVMLKQNSAYNGGTMVGGIVGAAVGAQVSRNTHNYAARTLATAISGIGGAAIGTRISNGNSARPALQVFVRDDRTGRVKAYVQDNDQQGMQLGAEVAIIHSGSATEIVPMSLPRDMPQQRQAGYGQPQPQTTRYVREGGYPSVQSVSSDSVNPAVIQNIVRSRSYP